MFFIEMPCFPFSYDLTLEQSRELTVHRLYFVLKLPLMKRHLSDQVKEQ